MNAWYAQLAKPAYTPPGWVFGVVWPVLYGLILAGIAAAVSRTRGRRRAIGLAIMAVNLLGNACWSPLMVFPCAG